MLFGPGRCLNGMALATGRGSCITQAASAVPLTQVGRVADADEGNHESHELHEWERNGAAYHEQPTRVAGTLCTRSQPTELR
jgi:hypothetical protein